MREEDYRVAEEMTERGDKVWEVKEELEGRGKMAEVAEVTEIEKG